MKKVIIGCAVVVAILILVLTYLFVTMRNNGNSITLNTPSLPSTTPIQPEKSTLSNADISKKVAALPEVKTYIATVIKAKGKAFIVADSHNRLDTSNNQQYLLVHVFQGTIAHPNTFGWYRYYVATQNIQAGVLDAYHSKAVN
jgi:hypothetical protein